MAVHRIRFAAEITADIEADTRAEALAILRSRSHTADLWAPFNQAAAERGEPTKGVHGVAVRVIGAVA